jgi:DNA primase
MGIVDDDVERVRAAVSLVDLVQQHVALRRVGRRWVGLCPFHAEKTGSFNVNEELGFYKCFGCGASGDSISFVRQVEHTDFVGAVEWLANKAGIVLHYTSGGESRDRQQRKRLLEAMVAAVDWYHDRLLVGPDARPARDYLRSRGIDGDTARRFRLGWAPDDWDALSRSIGLADEALRDTGLAFVNKRNRLQDTFRARLLFPIMNDAGDPVAFGGRILPGSADPSQARAAESGMPKYKNSPETSIYAKSKTLYGLNWAKADIVNADQVIVCEGYTDVIGFHRVGITRAVATCGTALTEDHVRILKRFANRVVLAFDADAAGQGAAERFYEWERKYDVQVSVAKLPAGKDPADLASSDPEALRESVGSALPFLGFRLQRVLRAGRPATPEARVRLAEAAMGVVNEHPDVNVRKVYAGEVAAHCSLPVKDLVQVAMQRRPQPRLEVPISAPRSPRENAEVVALGLLVHRWDAIAPWLVEALFTDDACVTAFRALAESDGDWHKALEIAEPAGRELLERLAVDPPEADPDVEARSLIAAAARREVERIRATGDLGRNAELVELKRNIDDLFDADRGSAAAERLLTWLDRADEERA